MAKPGNRYSKLIEYIFTKNYEDGCQEVVFQREDLVSTAIQLGIVSLTSAPAIDVEISLLPLSELLCGFDKYFPLRIPMIDRDNPFFFDVTTWYQAEEQFGQNVRLCVVYKDLANNSYVYDTPVSVANSISPLMIGSDSIEKMAKTLESIQTLLKKIMK